MHVPDYLAQHGIPFQSLWHPPAFSASKRAKYLQIPGLLVAKNILMWGPHGFFLAVLPATHSVWSERLAQHLKGPVRLAGAAELARVFPDCEWGVVPAFGKPYGVPTLLDESFDPEAWLVFEGNTHVEAVRLLCRDYERLARPRRLCLARRAQGSSASP